MARYEFAVDFDTAGIKYKFGFDEYQELAEFIRLNFTQFKMSIQQLGTEKIINKCPSGPIEMTTKGEMKGSFTVRMLRGNLVDIKKSRLPIPFKDESGNIIGQVVEVWYDGEYTCGKVILNKEEQP